MVRFRRQSSTPTGAGASEALTGMRSISLSDQLSDSDEDNSHGLLRRSRRRSKTKTTKPTNENSDIKEGKKKKKEKPIYEDEMDPYDSDPGESYRSHCLKINGIKTSCLRIPRRLKNTATEKDETTTASSPPSPVSSELDDILQHTPETLPSNTTRVRYSLRTSIGDGSQSQPNGPSLMSRRELRPNNVQVNVSHWSDCGARPYMEDRYSVEDLGTVQVEVSPVAVRSSGAAVEVSFGAEEKKCTRLKMPLTWLAVFDGHGGDKASQYCADWLSSYVRNEDCFPFDLGFAMKKAFTNIDEDFINTGYPDGTTACAVSLVGGKRIICANAGDSRAIVVRKDGSVVRVSRDHKPGMPDETKRITELGGRVIYWGRWRVEGLLAVSRAIGDASLKPYVTSNPEVCEYDVGPDDWFLIISSDGVWDVLDNEEAAHVVIATSCVIDDGNLVIDTDRFKWAARNLLEHAKSCGSTDNFSAIVVDLQSCGNDETLNGKYKPRS